MRTVSTDVPSLNHLFFARVEATPLATAYLVRQGEGWTTWTWRAVYTEVQRLSAGLRTLGVEGQGAVLCQTRIEWLLADAALLAAGLPTTTIYPSSTGDTTRYILQDAEVGVVFAEDPAQLAKLLEAWPEGLAHVVLIDGDHPDPRVLSWAELGERGDGWLARHGAALWREEALEAGPEDLATLIYTSGTTGRPKGVRLVHDNWLAQAVSGDQMVGQYGEDGDLLYLWLPLAHAYGKVLQLAGIATGVPTVIDGDHERIPIVLKELSPTWVPVVPRVLEKIVNRVRQQAAERGKRPAQVLEWALGIAVRAGQTQGAWPLELRLKHAIADRLVFRKVRAGMGGRVRAFLCGSAPLTLELEQLYAGMGLPVLQGYGLTECAAVATVNLPEATEPGSVGRCIEGMEARTVEGELQLRGRAVMRGYHGLPEATAAAFDDGWFRTGDLGTVVDGVVRITGRAKELLITSGGKNIAPAPIEGLLKSRCGLLQEVVLVGDGRPTLMALVTLDVEAASSWAAGRGVPLSTDDPALRERIQAAVDEVNAGLASFETIKRFAVLPQPFSIESGELTPSQKVRRSVVVERCADVIAELYR